MPAKRKTPKKTRRAANPAHKQVAQLRKSFKVLKSKLERETRARKIEARIKSEAQKAGARLTGQLKALREQGNKLASELKSALNNASKRASAHKEAQATIEKLKAQYTKTSAELRAELARKTADLRRKSEELMKLAGDSAHRAAEIIRGEEHREVTGAGSVESEHAASPEPHGESAPDDDGPDQER